MPIDHYNSQLNYADFKIDYIIANENVARYSCPHTHNAGEFILVTKGCSTIISNSQIFFGKGQYLFYAPPGCIHEQANNTNYEYERYCFTILPEFIGQTKNPLPNVPFIIDLNNEHYHEIEMFVSLMYKLYTESPKKLSGERLKHLLLLFINEIGPLLQNRITSKGKEGSLKKKKTYIERVCLYISLHYTEHIAIDRIANNFFISRSKLTRDFREVMHMSVSEYISIFRINKSIQLLLEGTPLADIAYKCGFSSISYYIRSFKKHMGTTPIKYLANQSST